jgi:hypothetical protein
MSRQVYNSVETVGRDSHLGWVVVSCLRGELCALVN